MSPQGLEFLPSIRFGDIVIAISVVGSVVGAYQALRGRLTLLETLLSRFERTLESHGVTLNEHDRDIAGLNAIVGRRATDHPGERRQ